jgi:hypothetical protein
LFGTTTRKVVTFSAAVAAVVSFVAAGLDLWDRIRSEDEPPPEFGEETTSGPFGIRPIETSCDATIDDVPEEAMADLPSGFEEEMTDPSNQMCTATIRVRNDSDMQRQAVVGGTLHVREREFRSLLFYEIPPLLSPDQSEEVTILFLLPKGETPTELELQPLDLEEAPDQQPDPVEFLLP